MSLRYDPEYFEVLKPLLPVLAKRPQLTLDSIVSSRKARDAGIEALLSRLPDCPDVETTYHSTHAPDGCTVSIIKLAKSNVPSGSPTSALLHFHGGGMIVGSAQMYVRPLSQMVQHTGIPIFTVDYRLAPEHTGTALVDDCYAALVWLQHNAQEHNVDASRVAVYGESAGGGLAAGLALMARDRKLQPPIAKQILVYPMLDDRNMTPNAILEPLAFWKTADNIVAWTAVLGKDKTGKPDAEVSSFVAPARAQTLAGLPPTYIDVGELDIFRDEDIAYATKLMAKNIPTELHVYSGVPHAFEALAPNISVAQRALENRLRAMQSL
jgi:acetyl esterase/lipase